MAHNHWVGNVKIRAKKIHLLTFYFWLFSGCFSHIWLDAQKMWLKKQPRTGSRPDTLLDTLSTLQEQWSFSSALTAGTVLSIHALQTAWRAGLTHTAQPNGKETPRTLWHTCLLRGQKLPWGGGEKKNSKHDHCQRAAWNCCVWSIPTPKLRKWLKNLLHTLYTGSSPLRSRIHRMGGSLHTCHPLAQKNNTVTMMELPPTFRFMTVKVQT